MPLADIVTITITLQTKASTRPGFGIPLVVGELPAAVVTAGLFTDRVVVLTSTGFADSMLALGFVTTDDLYVAVQTEFAQDPSPDEVYLGRRVTPVAQIDNVLVDAALAGTYTVTINGIDFTFVAAAETTTQIRDALVTAINLVPGAVPVTAAPGAGDSLDLTADEAGVSFTVAVDHTSGAAGNISTSNSTPNLGIVEDLIAISAENDGWYALVETTHSDGVILTAAPYIETQSKIFGAQTNSADVLLAPTTDVLSSLQLAAFARTFGIFDSDDTEYLDAAWTGDALPTDPGSITWAYRELSTVVPSVGVTGGLTATQLTNLNAKNGNYYERIAGRNVTRHGRMADGTFIDLIRGRDWLEANLALDIFDLLANEDKVPYTDAGANQVASVVLARLNDAASRGIVVRDSIVVTVPLVADVPVNDRANRHLPDVNFSATLQGAIHTLDITGTLAV